VGAPPETVSAEAGAQRLLAAFKADDPSLAHDFFFPADAFDLVKDMAVPGRYHRRLVAWYEEDIHAEHERYRRAAEQVWVFERFELGHCAWMAVHTEGNKLPYWSCRRSRFTASAGERTLTFEIHVLINWGRNWYVTHLGPIRN